MFYVKSEQYFFKDCKTKPLNGYYFQSGCQIAVKNLSWKCSSQEKIEMLTPKNYCR